MLALHVTGDFSRTVCGGVTPACTPWVTFNEALVPLRIPLFFAISGMFARGALARPWRDVVGARVLSPLYVYYLWTVLTPVLLILIGAAGPRRVLATWERAWLGHGAYWYLFALALFFVLTRLTLRLPARVVLVGAAVLAVAVPVTWHLVVDGRQIDPRVWRYSVNLLFFLVGARGGTVLMALARRADRGQLRAVAVLTLMGLVTLRLRLPDSDWLYPLLCLGFVATGVVLAAWAARHRGTRAFGRTVGRQTLGVYVLGGFAAQAIAPWWAASLPPVLAQSTAVRLGFVPVTVTVIVVVSLAGYTLLQRVGLGLLFRLPGVGHSRPSADHRATALP